MPCVHAVFKLYLFVFSLSRPSWAAAGIPVASGDEGASWPSTSVIDNLPLSRLIVTAWMEPEDASQAESRLELKELAGAWMDRLCQEVARMLPSPKLRWFGRSNVYHESLLNPVQEHLRLILVSLRMRTSRNLSD